MESETETAERRWLDYEGLAAYLNMTPAALRVRVSRGELPRVKIGRRVLFDRVAIDRALEARAVPAGS